MNDSEVPDAARAALERARLAAKENPVSPSKLPAALRRRARAGQHYSGARPDDRDPQQVGGVWAAACAENGWNRALDAAKVRTLWPQIVGPANAEHTTVEQFDPETGVLTVRAHSTAWAQQLRLMMPLLRTRVDEAIGSGVVTDISVAGPVGPSWVKGRLRVKGRGPRDTYG